MHRQVIGTKAKTSIPKVALIALGGLALIVGGISSWIFLLRGAIGGGITGGLVAMGGALMAGAFMPIFLPRDLVALDDTNLYLAKRAIPLHSITDIRANKNALTINATTSNKPIVQNFVNEADYS
ncbi:MAG: hypothetical protein FWE13_02485 [Firmicutes bacterium]|nr:hypothetical protein [Bacillota bacterium]